MRNPLRSLTATGVVMFLALSGSAHGQAPPAQPGDVPLPQPTVRKEHPLYSSLKDVINQGVTLFNDKADYAGCYRLYQGAIIAVRPYLTNDPELLKFVDDSLKRAEKEPRVVDRAFALRGVLDSIRDHYRPEGAKPSRPLSGTEPGKKPVEVIPVPKKGDKAPGSASSMGTNEERKRLALYRPSQFRETAPMGRLFLARIE